MKHILGYVNREPVLFDTDKCPVCKSDFYLATKQDETSFNTVLVIMCPKCLVESIIHEVIAKEDLVSFAKKAQEELKAYLKTRP